MQGEDKLCNAVWSEALVTERGGNSGGVAIISRSYLDVGYRN